MKSKDIDSNAMGVLNWASLSKELYTDGLYNFSIREKTIKYWWKYLGSEKKTKVMYFPTYMGEKHLYIIK